MRVLAAAGDREAAIRCGDVYAVRVREELVAAPDPAVTGLAVALRRGEGRVAGGDEGHMAGTPSEPVRIAGGHHAGGVAALPRPARISRYRRMAPGLIVLIVVAVWLFYGGLRAMLGTPSTAETGPVVAVLPFTSLGGDRSDSLFVAGMHTEFLTQLHKLGSIVVIGHLSASLHGTEKSLVEIARELDADALLVGSMGRASERFRLRVQLVDGETGRTLWAEAYDDSVTVDRLLDVQETVSLRLAEGLQVALTADEQQRLAERPEPTLQAYEHFATGETHFRNGRWAQALASFDSAVAAEPGYARAQAAVAKAASMSYFMYAGDHARERAMEALRHARRMAPTAPETHMADGFVNLLVDANYDAAIRSLQIAMQAFPNDSDLLYWYNVAYTLPLRLDSAEAVIRRAYLRDPNHASVVWQVGFVAAIQWKFREASRHFDHAAQRAPDHWMIFHQRWMVYFWGLGDTARARTVVEDAGPAIPRTQIVEKWAQHAYVARDAEALAEIIDSMEAWPELRQPWKARLAHLLGDDSARRTHGDSMRETRLSELEHAQSHGVPRELLASLTGGLALAHAISGEQAAAVQMIQRAVRLAEDQSDKLNMQGTYYLEALTYAFLDMPEVGIQRLDSVFADRRLFPVTPVRLRFDPDFDSFRRSPRFRGFPREV